MKRILAGLLLPAMLLVACGTDETGGDVSRGEPVDFSFTTFEGEEFSSDKHRGVPVVLNFWESW